MATTPTTASEIGRALVALRYARMTPEQRKEAARRAGIASGAARRRKAAEKSASGKTE